MSVTVKVEGLKELDAKLSKMKDQLAKRAIRNAVRAGAEIILRDAKARVPRGPGHFNHSRGKSPTRHLRDALRITTSFRDLSATAAITPGKAAFLANWLERTGAKPHDIVPFDSRRHRARTKRHGFAALFIPGVGARNIVHHPGMKPKPFMKPAFDSQWRAALDKFEDILKAQIQKLTSK